MAYLILQNSAAEAEQLASPTCHGGNAKDHSDRQLDLGALQTHPDAESVGYNMQNTGLS